MDHAHTYILPAGSGAVGIGPNFLHGGHIGDDISNVGALTPADGV